MLNTPRRAQAPAARPLAAALSAAALLWISPAHGIGCGTALYFEKARRQGFAPPPPAPAGTARAASLSGRAAVEDGYPARTLVSDNFLLHYSLRSWHRIHLEPADSALTRLSDSLYAAFAGRNADARDSAVYAALDSLGAPHPVYVRKLREYFEAARAYYVGALGMKAPSSTVLSVHYKVDPSLPRRFPVDIVDVGTADPEYAGETYAITYPPASLSISFENDFLCFTSLDAQGHPKGTHIASRLDGRVIHDYAVEWDLGLKVTAFHEFYHAVQFTYVPHATYHAWYEISATGMEERNAPEVDDYLQYLPCVLRNHDDVSLLQTQPGPCTHAPMYGHAIFHQYLSRALDSAFDVKVWEQLGRNGDNLKDGLETAFAAYGRTTADLYSEYAAENFFAGERAAPPDPSVWSTRGLYSSDFPKWPDIAYDSVDLEGDPYRVITLSPLTYGILKIKWGKTAAARMLQAKVATGITRIHAGPDTSIVERLGENLVTLGAPRAGFDAYYLVLPNPSFTEKATLEIKDPDAEFYAYPNPVRARNAMIFFSQAKDMGFPAAVRVYGESGRLARELAFSDPDQALTWDLKDAAGEAVKPGLYYYRLGNGPLKALVVLH